MTKRFRKLPRSIIGRVEQFGGAVFHVGAIQRIPLQDIADGKWVHVGIEIDGGQAISQPSILPNGVRGLTSRFNASDKIIIRTDLPKEMRQIDLGDRPIYGDWSRGSFNLTVDKMCYPRETVVAPRIHIEVRLLITEEVSFGVKIVVFRASRAHSRESQYFEQNLLHDVNLMQENVGMADVILADATDDDLLRRIYVNWEILPPGERDTTLAAVLNKYRPRNEDERRLIQERYLALAQYNPDRWIVGANRFSGYFGIIRGGDVVLENVRYGNALYRLKLAGWDQLSKLSRTELMANHSDRVERIVHRAGWEGRLAGILRS